MSSDSCPVGRQAKNPCMQAIVQEDQHDPEAGGVSSMLGSPELLRGDMASMIEIGTSSAIPTQKRGADDAASLSNNNRVLHVDHSCNPQKGCSPTFRNGNCMDALQGWDNGESTPESGGENCSKAGLFSSLGQLGEEAKGHLTKKEDLCHALERGASGEMQDELWTLLEAISFASEHLQEELVQAQHRELLLAREVARLREKDCDLGRDLAHGDGKESQRLVELEKTTERLQDAVSALEKANMVLRGRLESRSREMGHCLMIDEGGLLQNTGGGNIGSKSAVEITGFQLEDEHANVLGWESEGKAAHEGLAVKVCQLEKEKCELESELVQQQASMQSFVRNYSTLKHRMHSVDTNLEDVKVRLAETKRLNRVYLKELKRLLHRYEDLRLHAGVLEKERGTFQTVLLEKQTLEQELESERAARAEAEQQLVEERRQEGCIAGQNEVLSDCDEHARYQLVDKEKRALEVELANKDRQLAELRDQYEPVVHQQDGSAGLPQQRGFPSYPGDVSTPLSLAIHGLIEERNALQRELASEAAARHQLEVDGLRWEEERLLLSACLCTVEKERNLLQAEMRELHRDYLSLSRQVGVRLAELNHVGSTSTCTITDNAVVSQARSEDSLSIQPPSNPPKTSLGQLACQSVPEERPSCDDVGECPTLEESKVLQPKEQLHHANGHRIRTSRHAVNAQPGKVKMGCVGHEPESSQPVGSSVMTVSQDDDWLALVNHASQQLINGEGGDCVDHADGHDGAVLREDDTGLLQTTSGLQPTQVEQSSLDSELGEAQKSKQDVDLDPANTLMDSACNSPGRLTFMSYLHVKGSPPAQLTAEEEVYAEHIIHKYLHGASSRQQESSC